jgi:polyferredoxin
VQTCPTGIDIRNGLQMECVHCTQCIDACDEIMDKVGKPRGLIRYSSQDALDGRPRRLLRPRTVLYPLVLAVLLGGLAVALIRKPAADLTLLRGLGAPFTEEPDGRIANQLRIKLTNRRGDPMRYTIRLDGLEALGGAATVVAPENPLPVDAGATRATSVFVLLPRRAFTAGERRITVRVRDDRGAEQSVPYRLLGPTDAPAAPPSSPNTP